MVLDRTIHSVMAIRRRPYQFGDAARKKIGSGLTNSFNHAREVLTESVDDACGAQDSVGQPMATLHSVPIHSVSAW